ncbi:MAG: sodium:proton antiporter [Blastopirellula sp.]|nr:MAG: sodium:proton antiporter [Blastopirellula sp.]
MFDWIWNIDADWWRILPPLLTIVLAIATRRILISLLIGVFCGTVIIACFNHFPLNQIPFDSVVNSWVSYLQPTLLNPDKLQVFGFTLIMGAMVGLITVSGGMRGLVELIIPWANTRIKGQIATWVMGLAIFFDDYANMLLLGGTMRPLTDRLKISREKLAYLIDSTAAPVAGLALVSTWVAGEIGYVSDGMQAAGLEDWTAVELFMYSMPYRFYALWALVFVAIIAITGRDFGPMLKAERKAFLGDASAIDKNEKQDELEQADEVLNARWFNAVLPVFITLFVIVGWLYYTGYKTVVADELELSLLNIFGNSASYSALLYGAIAGFGSAVLLIVPQRILSEQQTVWGIYKGAKAMVPCLMILWFSGALASVTKDLETGQFLAETFLKDIPVWILPTLVFALSAGIAFSTGTSWGTMALVMPLAIATSVELMTGAGLAITLDSQLLSAVVGSVLAGAIFGDHCSPISDTTILSSQSTQCDHIAHVRTQMPYALVVGLLAMLLGTIPVGLGMNVYLSHLLGVAAMLAVILFFGKSPDSSTN